MSNDKNSMLVVVAYHCLPMSFCLGNFYLSVLILKIKPHRKVMRPSEWISRTISIVNSYFPIL